MDEIIAVYNAIRTQSLTSKDQRFKLYYWKVLSVIVLLGFSITNSNLIKVIDAAQKTFLIALVIPLIVILFDITISSRKHAIERDGELLKGLEDLIASKAIVRKDIFPERFYEERREKYWASKNRLKESLPQYLFSIFAIIISFVIHYKASQGINMILLTVNVPISIIYLILILIQVTKMIINMIKTLGKRAENEQNKKETE